MQRLHEQGRVQFVDVILVDDRLVEPSQPSRDLLRQLRVAIVKQPGQQKPKQSSENRNPGKDQLRRMTSLRFGPFVASSAVVAPCPSAPREVA